MKQVVFVVHVKDAEDLIASGLKPDEVFSFCPAATYTLRKAGLNVCTPADYYGSLSHAKTAIHTTRKLPKLIELGREAFGLDEEEISGFRSNLIYVLNWSYYVYYSTRHYRGQEVDFVFGEEVCSSYNDLLNALLRDTSRLYNFSYENTEYSRLNYHIGTLCNWLIRVSSRASRSVRVLNFGESALDQIEQVIAAHSENMRSFRPRVLGRTALHTLRITLGTIVRALSYSPGALNYFRLVPPERYKRLFQSESWNYKSLIEDRGVYFPARAICKRVVSDSGWYLTFLRAQCEVGAVLARVLRPHLIMTNKGKYHFIRSAIFHAPKSASASVLINHGTHTAQPPGSISQMAGDLWASDNRTCVEKVQYVIPRLPLTEQQIRDIYGKNLPQFLHIPAVKKIVRNPGDPEQNFRVIFAGNYYGPLYHVPWCVETADEYLLGMLQLIEQLGGMEGVELIIRLKAVKASAHVHILEEKIAECGYRNVRIDTDTKFSSLLETAHLLISNLSTTVEEAVTNGIPLLLHSYRKHYFHLPCSFDVASDGSSGKVYGVKKGNNARDMVAAIRAHYRAIDSGQGTSRLVWQENQFNDLREFAVSITKLAEN